MKFKSVIEMMENIYWQGKKGEEPQRKWIRIEGFKFKSALIPSCYYTALYVHAFPPKFMIIEAERHKKAGARWWK